MSYSGTSMLDSGESSKHSKPSRGARLLYTLHCVLGILAALTIIVVGIMFIVRYYQVNPAPAASSASVASVSAAGSGSSSIKTISALETDVLNNPAGGFYPLGTIQTLNGTLTKVGSPSVVVGSTTGFCVSIAVADDLAGLDVDTAFARCGENPTLSLFYVQECQQAYNFNGAAGFPVGSLMVEGKFRADQCGLNYLTETWAVTGGTLALVGRQGSQTTVTQPNEAAYTVIFSLINP